MMSGAQSLNDGDRELLDLAMQARARAYAPYSGYAVGCALRTSSGRIYPGCNVENATNGLTLCAERVAVFSALADSDDTIEAMAVVVPDGKPARPCGICRELIREFAPGARLILADGHGSAVVTSLPELLPSPRGASS